MVLLPRVRRSSTILSLGSATAGSEDPRVHSEDCVPPAAHCRLWSPLPLSTPTFSSLQTEQSHIVSTLTHQHRDLLTTAVRRKERRQYSKYLSTRLQPRRPPRYPSPRDAGGHAFAPPSPPANTAAKSRCSRGSPRGPELKNPESPSWRRGDRGSPVGSSRASGPAIAGPVAGAIILRGRLRSAPRCRRGWPRGAGGRAGSPHGERGGAGRGGARGQPAVPAVRPEVPTAAVRGEGGVEQPSSRQAVPPRLSGAALPCP